VEKEVKYREEVGVMEEGEGVTAASLTVTAVRRFLVLG